MGVGGGNLSHTYGIWVNAYSKNIFHRSIGTQSMTGDIVDTLVAYTFTSVFSGAHFRLGRPESTGQFNCLKFCLNVKLNLQPKSTVE